LIENSGHEIGEPNCMAWNCEKRNCKRWKLPDIIIQDTKV